MIANARMYAVSPSADAAWKALLGHVIARSELDIAIVDHAYPHKLPELWARTDLACVFMCGWPFIREGGGKTLLAAPVPDADWAADRAQYVSQFIVARDSPLHSLADARGHRFAYNARDSHSGYNAPRAVLAGHPHPYFSATLGPYITHQRVVAAVASGEADIAAIDGFTLLLLARHDPELAAQVRAIGATPACPIPALVANALTDQQAEGLRMVLTGLHGTEHGRRLLEAVCLRRFDRVEAGAYEATLAMETLAVGAGYLELE